MYTFGIVWWFKAKWWEKEKTKEAEDVVEDIGSGGTLFWVAAFGSVSPPGCTECGIIAVYPLRDFVSCLLQIFNAEDTPKCVTLSLLPATENILGTFYILSGDFTVAGQGVRRVSRASEQYRQPLGVTTGPYSVVAGQNHADCQQYRPSRQGSASS